MRRGIFLSTYILAAGVKDVIFAFMPTIEEILAENERRNARMQRHEEAPPGTFEAWARDNVKIKPKGGGSPIP